MEIDQQDWSPPSTATNTATTKTGTSSPPQPSQPPRHTAESFYLRSDQATVEFAKQTMPIEKVVISATGCRSHENSNLSGSCKQQEQQSSYNRTYALTEAQVRTVFIYFCLFFLFAAHSSSPLLRHFLPAFHHNVLIPIVPYLHPHGLTIGRTGSLSSCLFFI